MILRKKYISGKYNLYPMEPEPHQHRLILQTCLWCGSILSEDQIQYCSTVCEQRFSSWLHIEQATRRGIRPPFWNIIRRKVLERDGARCQICGSNADLSVHHIIPLSEGGDSTMGNLRCLCFSCHQKEHGRRMPFIRVKKTKIRIRHQPMYVPAILACEWLNMRYR